jgi:small-conductance mechanosensitive channel
MERELEQVVDQAVQEAVAGQLFIQGGITTTIAIVSIFLLRYFLTKFVKGRAEFYDEDQRRWLNRINNGTVLSILVLLVFIWAPQIQTFALSLTAFAVAVVLTIRELLMCLTGGFLRATSKPFEVGDWITVDNLTGEVMQIRALVTTIEEIDTAHRSYQFTGRTIQIPNSRFLTSNAENANFIKNYVYHDIPITVQYGDLDPTLLMNQLQTISEKYFAPFREAARRFNKTVEKKVALDFEDPEPQLFLRTRDDGHNIFTVRMFIPTKKTAEIGTNVTCDFLKYAYDLRTQREKND